MHNNIFKRISISMDFFILRNHIRIDAISLVFENVPKNVMLSMLDVCYCWCDSVLVFREATYSTLTDI